MDVGVLLHVGLLVEALAAVGARVRARVGVDEQVRGQRGRPLEALQALRALEALFLAVHGSVLGQTDGVSERLAARLARERARACVRSAHVNLESVRRGEVLQACQALEASPSRGGGGRGRGGRGRRGRRRLQNLPLERRVPRVSLVVVVVLVMGLVVVAMVQVVEMVRMELPDEATHLPDWLVGGVGVRGGQEGMGVGVAVVGVEERGGRKNLPPLLLQGGEGAGCGRGPQRVAEWKEGSELGR